MVAVAVDAIAAKHQLFHQAHPRTDAGIVKDDRVVDRGVFADVAIGADHGRANDGGSVFDLGHAAHVNGPGHVDLIPVGGHIQARIDPWTHLFARNFDLAHLALEHAADRLPVVGHLADIHPLEFHRQGVEGSPGCHQLGEQVGADIKRLVAGNEIQHLRLKDVDARVDHVAGGLIHLRLLLEGAHPAIVVGDHDAVAAHLVAGDPFGDQAGEGAFGFMALHRFGEIEVDQGVPAEHDEGVVEEALEVLNLFESTGGTHGIADQFAVFDAAFKAVGNFDAETLTIAEVILDLLSQVGDVHHDFGKAVLPQ